MPDMTAARCPTDYQVKDTLTLTAKQHCLGTGYSGAGPPGSQQQNPCGFAAPGGAHHGQAQQPLSNGDKHHSAILPGLTGQVLQPVSGKKADPVAPAPCGLHTGCSYW